MRTFISNKRLSTAVAVVFWIGVWQLVSMLVNNTITIASPVDTVKALAGLAVTSSFWVQVGNTAFKILLGFVVALAAGILLAGLSHAVPLIWALVNPLARVIKAVPVASFIIMALLWIRSAWLPCFISFLMVFPIIYINVYAGLASADTRLLEAARVFRTPFSKRLKNIYFPAAAPQLLSACRAGLGLCWKAGIAAEVIVLPSGTIGEQLYYAKLYLQTPELFAYTVAIVAASALFEKLIIAGLTALTSRYGGVENVDKA